MAWLMRRTLRVSGSESLAAAANVFMGQTEAPLLVKPYLPKMTRSEVMALMTCGMATIAGSMLTVYVGFGVDAGHLFTASMMSAPGAFVIAKIMLPETEKSETADGNVKDVKAETTNAVDALCTGASDGMKLSINVIAMLVAFLAMVSLANILLGFVLQPFGLAVTFQNLIGWLNTPFAWLIGVPAQDCVIVGQALGERIVLNEFVGYMTLVDPANREQLDPRSFTLATYALCGFANFGSIAIQIGGIGALVPEKRATLAALGGKAMAAGVLACYMTAAIVGILL
jgi:CNT family concentrative nucleoside transporter